MARRRGRWWARWNAVVFKSVKGITRSFDTDALEELSHSGKSPKRHAKALVVGSKMLRDRGDLKTALGVANRIRVLVDSPLIDHGTAVNALAEAAETYRVCEDVDEEVVVCRRLLDLETEEHGSDDPKSVHWKEYLADALYRAGSVTESSELRREVVDWYKGTISPIAPETAIAETNLGVSLIALDHLDEARNLLEHATEILESRDFHRARGAYGWLAAALGKQGDLEGALAARERAFQLARKAYSDDDYRTLDASDRVAVTMWSLGQRDEARTLLASNLASRERLFGDSDPKTESARRRLDELSE